MKILITGLVSLLCSFFSIADMGAPGEGNITKDTFSRNGVLIQYSLNGVPIRNASKSDTTDTTKYSLNGVPIKRAKNSYGTGLNSPNNNASRGGGDIECACDSAYSVGDRVTLLIDNPDGNADLFAGTMGTVLCGWGDGAGNSTLMVEWDNFASGHDNNNCGCNIPDVGTEPNRWWVNCEDVEAYEQGGGDIECACDSAYSVGDRVTLLIDNPDGNADLFAGTMGTVLCGWGDGAGNSTLMVEWDNFASGHDNNNCGCNIPDVGTEPNRWWVNCEDVEAYEQGGGDIECACDSAYSVGDRVTLLIDNPDGNADLFAGTMGTVLCGWGDGAGNSTLMVEWDNFASGHDNNNCGCNIPDVGTEPNRWWVNCEDVEAYEQGGGDIECACDSAYSVGDRVTLLIDNPDGNADLFAGTMGTVLCGWGDGAGNSTLMVEWDNFASGHDNNNCGCNIPDVGTEPNRWWVNCEDVEAESSLPCPEDINGDGTVDVSDLLQLIGAWGLCP